MVIFFNFSFEIVCDMINLYKTKLYQTSKGEKE